MSDTSGSDKKIIQCMRVKKSDADTFEQLANVFGKITECQSRKIGMNALIQR